MKQLQFLIIALFLSITSANSFETKQEEITFLKQEILALAYSFEGQADIDGSKQEEIEVKIQELLLLVPRLSFQDRAVKAIGAWRQVWGPYAFDDSQTVPDRIDVKNIYQVIKPEGYYYNFAQYNFGNRLIRSFLRGNFEIRDDRIAVEFNRTGLILGNSDTPMPGLVDGLENRTVRAVRFPDFLPPSGIRGGLIEIYADDEIRLNYGTVGDNLDNPALFVMERWK